MAARFWQGVLALQLALAIALSVAIGASFSLPSGAELALVPAIGVLSPWLTAGVALALLRPEAVPRSARGSLLRSLISLEPIHFIAAVLAMSAERWGNRLQGSLRHDRAGRPVLLIHGLLCNRALWHPLARRLSRAGFGPVRAVNLEPLTAGVDSHTKYIEQELLALQHGSDGARVTIITHSMGGLVARAALRALGPKVIRRIVTVACPHHGTLFAPHVRIAPVEEMRPGSPWLQALNAQQEQHLPVPVTSLYSLDDPLIVPAHSAELSGARCEALRGLGHFGLLRARGALDRIVDALLVE